MVAFPLAKILSASPTNLDVAPTFLRIDCIFQHIQMHFTVSSPIKKRGVLCDENLQYQPIDWCHFSICGCDDLLHLSMKKMIRPRSRYYPTSFDYC